MLKAEAEDLTETLLFTIALIVSSDVAERRHIAAAYAQALALVATIEPEHRSSRPAIVACLEQFVDCKADSDNAASGWMLTAIQGRLAEQDLPDWELLQVVGRQGRYNAPGPTKRLH